MEAVEFKSRRPDCLKIKLCSDRRNKRPLQCRWVARNQGPTDEIERTLVGKLPRRDSNPRPADTEQARLRAREQKTKRLASRKSRRKSRNGPESHPTDRTHTIPGEKERDA